MKVRVKMGLHESGEMYLETILILSKKSDTIRSLDVAEHMNYSKPSVSRAVGILKDGGFITVNDAGFLSLTPVGRETAEKIYSRHTLLTNLLVSLGVEAQTASEDACRMEHVISDTTYEALKKHYNSYLND